MLTKLLDLGLDYYSATTLIRWARAQEGYGSRFDALADYVATGDVCALTELLDIAIAEAVQP